MLNKSTREDENKIASVKLPREEFANLKKLCDKEGITVNKKIRELINKEIKFRLESFDKPLLIKMKEDNEKIWEKSQLKKKSWNFEVKKKKNV